MTNNDIIATMKMSTAQAWATIEEEASSLGWPVSELIKCLENDQISGTFELHRAASVLRIPGQAAIALNQAANLLSLS
jgi:hypothetical protein